MSRHRSRVTTHLLDATAGRPAAGVAAILERRTGSDWQEVATGRTDADGRISDLGLGPADLAPGA